MKYTLKQNLGLTDARVCNSECGAELALDLEALAAGSSIELPTKAAAYLQSKYPALLDDGRQVRGISEPTKVKGIGDAKSNQ